MAKTKNVTTIRIEKMAKSYEAKMLRRIENYKQKLEEQAKSGSELLEKQIELESLREEGKEISLLIKEARKKLNFVLERGRENRAAKKEILEEIEKIKK